MTKTSEKESQEQHERQRKKKNQQRHNQKPKNRLSKNIRTGIYKGLRTGKPGLWESRVGYTLAELRDHLQSQFEAGMSWSNYGQWQIDHIRAVSAFDFSHYDDEDFKRCWSLSNLRPLWASENWRRKKAVSRGDRAGDRSGPGIAPPDITPAGIRSRAISLATSVLLKSGKMSPEEIKAFIVKTIGSDI